MIDFRFSSSYKLKFCTCENTRIKIKNNDSKPASGIVVSFFQILNNSNKMNTPSEKIIPEIKKRMKCKNEK